MAKKDPVKMLEELLRSIYEDINNAKKNIDANSPSLAMRCLSKASGKIENFLCILGYLD